MHLVTLYILVTPGSLVYLTHIIGHFLSAASSLSWAISLSHLYLICCGVCYVSSHDAGQSLSQWKCHCSSACVSASYMLNTNPTRRVVNLDQILLMCMLQT
jgi:hypothetical protein